MALVRPPEAIPLLDAGVERSRVERSKLRRELGRLDAVCLLIAAIVVMDTLGAVARGGAQTVTWLAIVAALFFVPAGLSSPSSVPPSPTRAAPTSGPGWPSGATPAPWSRCDRCEDASRTAAPGSSLPVMRWCRTFAEATTNWRSRCRSASG